MKLVALPTSFATILLLPLLMGCSLVPESRERDRLHNPFPQLKRVAILPFFNQSSEPTLDTGVVTQQYYAELQAIPGFEVVPIGVTKLQFVQHVLQHGEPQSGQQFQELAKQMGVEALVVGSVTDFDAYYPPRLAMTVNWYAANEGFHPIPAGYGLPWGTENEKHIPKRIVDDAEFELARNQLATQTPLETRSLLEPHSPVETLPSLPERIPSPVPEPEPGETLPAPANEVAQMGFRTEVELQQTTGSPVTASPVTATLSDLPPGSQFHDDWIDEAFGAPLPAEWPDPTDLIPDPPMPHPPIATINREPVLSHTRIYRGDDPYFTDRLADHVETGDDARPGGWQGYLRRSDDFIRFCCHLHIKEMLESRGGTQQSDLILRWPLSRY